MELLCMAAIITPMLGVLYYKTVPIVKRCLFIFQRQCWRNKSNFGRPDSMSWFHLLQRKQRVIFTSDLSEILIKMYPQILEFWITWSYFWNGTVALRMTKLPISVSLTSTHILSYINLSHLHNNVCYFKKCMEFCTHVLCAFLTFTLLSNFN